MRINNLYIKRLEIEDTCPKCSTVSGTNMGSYYLHDLPETVEFNCGRCNHPWKRRIDQYWYMLKKTT